MPTEASRPGMHIEKAENLRLGEPECVQDSSRLQARILAQLNHHLHAQRPLALLVSSGRPKCCISLPPHRSHRAVRHHSQRGADIHTRPESFARDSVETDALIRQPNSVNRILIRSAARSLAFPATPEPLRNSATCSLTH